MQHTLTNVLFWPVAPAPWLPPLPDPPGPLSGQLADFGFSKDANDQSAPTSRVGTPAYLAPEVVGNRPGQVYDGKVITS